MSSSARAIVARQTAVAASPERVFAYVTDHARLPEWAPGLARVEVDDRNADEPGGAGTVRTLVPKLGRPGREVIRSLDREARCMTYSATDESLAGLCVDHQARIACEPTPGGTRLTFDVTARPSTSRWRWWVARIMFVLAARWSLARLRRRFDSAV